MLYSQSHNAPILLASLRSYRPDGWRLAIMAVLTVYLMVLALLFTTPVDLAAIADGKFSGFWGFLLAAAVLSGFVAGVLDTTKHEDLVATLPDSQIATLITRTVSRLVRTVVALAVNSPAAPLVVVPQISQRLRTLISRPILTPDLWPTGASPRLIYETA